MNSSALNDSSVNEGSPFATVTIDTSSRSQPPMSSASSAGQPETMALIPSCEKFGQQARLRFLNEAPLCATSALIVSSLTPMFDKSSTRSAEQPLARSLHDASVTSPSQEQPQRLSAFSEGQLAATAVIEVSVRILDCRLRAVSDGQDAAMAIIDSSVVSSGASNHVSDPHHLATDFATASERRQQLISLSFVSECP